MSSRISSLVVLALLAGCTAGEAQPQADAGAQAIECALEGEEEFAADCLVETSQEDGARVLTVREPDGGFRRFVQSSDGSGLTVADGADEAVQRLDGDRLEVTVGTDRYRFPARPVEPANGDE